MEFSWISCEIIVNDSWLPVVIQSLFFFFFFFDENEKVTTFKHFWPAQKVPI